MDKETRKIQDRNLFIRRAREKAKPVIERKRKELEKEEKSYLEEKKIE